MPRTLTAGLAAGALAVLAAPGLGAPDHDDEPRAERGAREVSEPALRLAVSDGARGRVTVVDLADRRVLGRIALAGPASLVAAGDGRHALATMGARGRIRVIDGGSWSVPHGDHDHHYVRRPRAVATIAANRPSHVVPHGSRVAIFGDGDARVTVVRHADLSRGARAAARFRVGLPHHGVAVPMGGRTIVSVQTPGAPDSLPGHLALAGPTGALGARRIVCPGLHGEAALGAARAIFACADGYVVIDTAGRSPRATRVAPATGTDSEARSFALSSAPALPYAIGDLDEQTLVRVDPATGTSAPIPVPAPRGAFALDGASRSVLVVTTDGVLHQIDAITGAVRASVAAVAPFSLEGEYSVPRPRVALGPERRAYVSDPGNGRVVEVATNPLRMTRTFAVGGKPVSLAVLGAN